MATLLVLCTDVFPFQKGEEFLELEITALTDVADDILVVPVRELDDRTQTRALPAYARALLPAPKRQEPRLLTVLRNLPRMLPMVKWWQKPVRIGVDAVFAANALEVAKRVRRVLPELSQYDRVLVYSYWFYTGVVVGNELRRHELRDTPVKIVARAHAYDVDETDSPRGYLPCRPYLLRAVEWVAAISDYAAKEITSRYPEFSDRVRVRRLGVRPAPHVSAPVDDRVWIVSCSHMAGYKRVPLIADTVAELKQRGVPVHWTHIGTPDPVLAKRMSDRLGDAVTFEGYLPNAQVREFYRDNPVTVFLNTSDGEGVPVTIMEAFAAGLPTVATDAGGTKELVHNGVNGRVVPIETTGAELADAVLDVVAHRSDMSDAALRTWDEMANGERQYHEWADQLREELNA